MTLTEEDVFMDPIACWTEINLAIITGDRDEIAEYADALAGWLERGGFMPPSAMKDGWRRTTLLTYCRDLRDVARIGDAKA